MKIAHIIMAHKNPEQLERLIRKMQHPMFDIYIHLDKKIDYEDFKNLAQLGNVFFIKNRVECNWGGYSFVKAILNSLKEVIDSDIKYGFINLMSGQDYPLKPANEIYQFLTDNAGRCFVSYESEDQSWWDHAVTRYTLYHFTDLKLKGKYFLQRVINKITPNRKFPLDVDLYGSEISSWWTITLEAAQYLIDFIEENKKVPRFMRFTWTADEFLIATVLMNSPFKNKIVNNNLRYIVWPDGEAHPKILSKSDLPEILKTEHFFARKFDTTVDSRILDLIDQNHGQLLN